MSRECLKRSGGLVAVVFLAACSSVAYSPRPLDPDATAAAFVARTADGDGLKQFASANGYDTTVWPPREWGLQELTLAALYFHSDIRTARARADVARAELDTATQSQAWSARVNPEYHSRRLPEDKGPWTLGLQLEIPLVAQGKRASRVERSTFLADAAQLDIADAAWTVRAHVRDRYLDLMASRDALVAIDAQIEARKEMTALVARRVEAGMLSARDLGTEHVALSQLELLRSQEAARQQRVRGELAAALGLPIDVVASMILRFDVRETEPDAAALQRMALQNRLDVHRRLLEFGAADAEVKGAVAAQNPDITLGPGYAWDQGDNIWSLAVGFTLPSGSQARAGIREAQARRELAAENFAATQAAAISAAQRASAQYRLARERVTGAQRQLQMQRDLEARTLRQFDAGSADRMQRVTAHLETLAAQSLVLAADVDVHQALALLEDAVQRPLAGDFEVLPDVAATRSAAAAGKP